VKCFKSGKQRRAEIKAARRAYRLAERAVCAPVLPRPGPVVPVDYSKLMANNSYGLSEFAWRGFYVDQPFCCCDCGAQCVWGAVQQRWWYETLGGSQYATAKRCTSCRVKERQRREQARQIAQAGLLEKQLRLAAVARH
jgi:hypothetical protein